MLSSTLQITLEQALAPPPSPNEHLSPTEIWMGGSGHTWDALLVLGLQQGIKLLEGGLQAVHGLQPCILHHT